MDLLNNFLNLILPPTSLISFFFFLPIYLFFKSLSSIIRSVFSEDVAGKVVLITGASSGIGEVLFQNKFQIKIVTLIFGLICVDS